MKCSVFSPSPFVPTQQPCTRRKRTSQVHPISFHSLTALASMTLSCLFSATTTAAEAASNSLAPYPVGGFAICQTGSSLHIQGGVAYSSSATYLVTTNQHFRLDLSQSFDSSSSSTSPPVWANLTSDYSPFQRFHAGACTPDLASFLTVGNADAVNTGSSGSGFMMAYSIAKGTWTAITQAVSATTNSNSGARVSDAGRTMPGFAVGGGTNGSQGVVIGGGWIPSTSNTPSELATSLTNLVTEADLIGFGKDGAVGSLTWSVASNSGNGASNVNSNLGPLAGAKVVILPSVSGKAVVLGGVTTGLIGGMSFGSLPIVDMVSGAVVMQKTQASSLLAAPLPRYGHCVALSADGNTIYMFGGSLVSTDKPTNDFYALDLRTWTWSRPTIKSSAVVPPSVRDHQCVVVGDQFLSLLGFNSNQAPASLNLLTSSGSGSSSIPSPPLIYVLSTSQWSWSTQYTPLPGTPSPPTPPNVPTDGNKGKVSGAGIAFGVIFGLAFAAVVGYLIFSHRRKQQRKAETLLLVEMQHQQKEEAKLEKERQKRIEQQQDADLPPLPPTAHAYHGNYQNIDGYGYNVNYSKGNNGNNISAAYYPPPGSAEPSTSYYKVQENPFQNPSYLHNQNTESQMGPNHYYSQAGTSSSTGGGGPDQNPFGQHPPVPATFVHEEMGYTPATNSGSGHVGNSSYNFNVPISGRPGDKQSFIEPASPYV